MKLRADNVVMSLHKAYSEGGAGYVDLNLRSGNQIIPARSYAGVTT